MLLNQQARKEVIVLARVTGPEYQGEIGLLLYNGGKEECVWNIGNALGIS